MDSLAPGGGFQKGSFIHTVPTTFPDLFRIVIVSMTCDFQMLVVQGEDQLHGCQNDVGGLGGVSSPARKLRCGI